MLTEFCYLDWRVAWHFPTEVSSKVSLFVSPLTEWWESMDPKCTFPRKWKHQAWKSISLFLRGLGPYKIKMIPWLSNLWLSAMTLTLEFRFEFVPLSTERSRGCTFGKRWRVLGLAADKVWLVVVKCLSALLSIPRWAVICMLLLTDTFAFFELSKKGFWSGSVHIESIGCLVLL